MSNPATNTRSFSNIRSFPNINTREAAMQRHPSSGQNHTSNPPVPSRRMYDDLPAEEAVVKAWAEPGRNPHYHQDMQNNVRRWMPLLARALDRLVDDATAPEETV